MSNFGEIIEPGSRTAWEDWDDNILVENQTRLSWLKDVAVPSEIQTLFLLEGRHIVDCMKTFAKSMLQHVNSITEVNLNIYRTEGNIYFCILKDYNLLHSSEIVELMKQYILPSNDVIAVITKPLAEYQTNEYLTSECILRSVTTSKPLKRHIKLVAPKLEQPNIVSGVTAGVISLREILDLSGKAIICYIGHEDYEIDELQELLRKLDFGPVQSQANSILNSNLYI